LGGVNSSGVKTYNSSNVLIEYNTFNNSYAAFYNKVNTTNVTFQYNHVYNCYKPFRLYGPPHTNTSTPLIAYNLFTGIDNWNAEADGDTGLLSDHSWHHNTIVPNSTGWETCGVGTDRNGSFQLDWHSNIIYRATGGSGSYGDMLIRDNDLNTFKVLSNNCYYTGANALAIRVGSTTYTSVASFASATGKESGSINQNPNFVGGAGVGPERYKLNSGTSPCYGKGLGGTNMGCYASAGQTEQIGWSTPYVWP
jgi:hypothetical protein